MMLKARGLARTGVLPSLPSAEEGGGGENICDLYCNGTVHIAFHGIYSKCTVFNRLL
jgi:hypothetical protein